jgi:S-adenosylmethionine hydrolase
MIALSSTCLAIATAIEDGPLETTYHQGRFGEYVAICDSHGTIETAANMDEARERIAEIVRMMSHIAATIRERIS